jgi:general stress protein YciG
MEKKPRGFAAMTPEQRRRIATLGGKAAQKGNGHRWTREEAITAGRKGGKATQAGGNAVRFTSQTGRAAARAREALRKKRGR